MAFTTSMSARRWPVVVLGSMGHGQNILAARYCSHATSDNDDEGRSRLRRGRTRRGNDGVLVVTTHYEHRAIPDDEDLDGFTAMVHVKAPMVGEEKKRTPLDLVAVLDVSGSMAGAKLDEVKRAMGLVVDSLGPRDRLSVVAFSDVAERVVPLTRMSEDGKVTAKLAVESLVAAAGSTSTNIRAGLDESAKVVEECRHDNDVAAVILLSDGYNNHSACPRSLLDTTTTADHTDLLPPYLVRDGRCRSTPVHTFAFGSDHDAEALHGISAATRGTFTFIDNNNHGHAASNLQDALARCVGGLRSVTAQHVSIEVTCQYLDLSITAVKSGRYENNIITDEGASVYVGELYADEERRFLLFMDVPRDDNDDYRCSKLITVSCSYTDMATGQEVSVAPAKVYLDVLRSSMVIERERLRVEAAEDVALAHAAAERGDYAEAARILAARRETVSRSAVVAAGDAASEALAAELDELGRRAAEEREYRRTGRASFLASMSAHEQQRSASVRLPRPLSSAAAGVQFGWAGLVMFGTPAMRKMEELWEMRRQQKVAPAPAPWPKDGGSKDGPPARSRLEARLAAAAPRISMLRRFRRLVPRIKL